VVVVEPVGQAVKDQIAVLFAQGASPFDIRVATGVNRHVVFRQMRRLARPPSPERVRSPLRFSFSEREEISRGLAGGASLRSIAVGLGRAPSSVSREVARNGGRRRYRACRAERDALKRACRPKPSKLAVCGRLRRAVSAKLEADWSPEQISGWLVETYPADLEMRVSHETIYLSLFVQAKGALRRELAHHLRSGRMQRRQVGYSAQRGQGTIRGMVNISERPAEIDDRAVPGHWEGDLLCGSAGTAIATLVERTSRFVMLVALPSDHRAPTVADALAARVRKLPLELRQSLTWDQGKEMADHARFTVESGVTVYFCDPRRHPPVAVTSLRATPGSMTPSTWLANKTSASSDGNPSIRRASTPLRKPSSRTTSRSAISRAIRSA
jgi:IS30 family transposase